MHIEDGSVTVLLNLSVYEISLKKEHELSAGAIGVEEKVLKKGILNVYGCCTAVVLGRNGALLSYKVKEWYNFSIVFKTYLNVLRW